MYLGEVNIAQEELNSFLAVAEDLQVKGLTQNNDQNQKPKRPNSIRPPVAIESLKTKEKDREPILQVQPVVSASQPKPLNQERQYAEEVIPLVKTESDQVFYNTSHPTSDTLPSTEVASMEESYEEQEFDYSGYEEGEEHGYETPYEGGLAEHEQNKGDIDLCLDLSSINSF